MLAQFLTALKSTPGTATGSATEKNPYFLTLPPKIAVP